MKSIPGRRQEGIVCLGKGGLHGEPIEGDEREVGGRRLDGEGWEKAHGGGLRPQLPQAKPALWVWDMGCKSSVKR